MTSVSVHVDQHLQETGGRVYNRKCWIMSQKCCLLPGIIVASPSFSYYFESKPTSEDKHNLFMVHIVVVLLEKLKLNRSTVYKWRDIINPGLKTGLCEDNIKIEYILRGVPSMSVNESESEIKPARDCRYRF